MKSRSNKRSVEADENPFYKISEGPIEESLHEAWYRTTTANDPSEVTSGQYGRGNYLSGSESEVSNWFEEGDTVYFVKVNHSQVLIVQESWNADTDEMLPSICRYLKLKQTISDWDEMNSVLQSRGFGGVWFQYAGGSEFLGFGHHVENWDVAEHTMSNLYGEEG